jgi:COP9 signalosome complex subunit 8
MTGPLTPPPSSALEIQDATRGPQPAVTPQAAAEATAPQQEEPATTAVPPPISTYKDAFIALSDLARSGQYDQLIRFAEDRDLMPADRTHPDRLLITVPLVLSYLIVDNIPPAQHALTRLPESLSTSPIPQKLVRLVASAAERRYENIYPRAREVHDVLQSTPISGVDLNAIAGLLLEKYFYAFRRRTFSLISKAFTSIPLPAAQRFLGCSADEVLQTAHEHGWVHNTADNTVSPALTLSGAVGILDAAGAQSTVATLGLIADMELE